MMLLYFINQLIMMFFFLTLKFFEKDMQNIKRIYNYIEEK